MEKISKKIPTGLNGLDELLYGGIRIDRGLNNEQEINAIDNGIIIMIYGESGVHKTLLAMQILHGLGKGIIKEKQGNENPRIEPSRFYSLNKNETHLQDMYLDFLICKQQKQLIKNFLSADPNNSEENGVSWAATMFEPRKKAVEDITKIDPRICKREIHYNSRTNALHDRKDGENDNNSNIVAYRKYDNLQQYCDDLHPKRTYITTNQDFKSAKKAHTRALNDYKKAQKAFNLANEKYLNAITEFESLTKEKKRKNPQNISIKKEISDNIKQHATLQNAPGFANYYEAKASAELDLIRKIHILSEATNKLYETKEKLNKADKRPSQNSNTNTDFFKDDFFEIEFNPQHADNDSRDPFYEQTTLDKYNRIAENIEDIEKQVPCIVIDGMSCMRDSDLAGIPFDHLEKMLREKALISIVVFDKRGTTFAGHADLVIEMRKNQSHLISPYDYFELQITKSVFRTAALGWHKYKKREDGIAIFPSLHRLLQERHYMERVMDITHRSFLVHDDCEFPDQNGSNATTSSNTDIKTKLENLLNSNLQLPSKDNLLEYILLNQTKNIQSESPKDTSSNSQPESSKDTSSQKSSSKKNDSSIVAFIGNPNSYKRFFALGGVYAAAKRGEHTLIILFDKAGKDMEAATLCPALKNKHFCQNPSASCSSDKEKNMDNKAPQNSSSDTPNTSDEKQNCPLEQCIDCVNKIHYFPIRMGAIFADEFLYSLKEQLMMTFPDEGKIRRIVIDDLQRVDYSFPFLHNDPLFLSALINLCRIHGVSLQILCDKSASLTQELCSLADSVLCFERDKSSLNNIHIYIERFHGSNGGHPCEIFKYTLKPASLAFSCTNNGVFINRSESKNTEGEINTDQCHISCIEIPSMKAFWRAKYDINPDSSIAVDINPDSTLSVDINRNRDYRWQYKSAKQERRRRSKF